MRNVDKYISSLNRFTREDCSDGFPYYLSIDQNMIVFLDNDKIAIAIKSDKSKNQKAYTVTRDGLTVPGLKKWLSKHTL